MRIRLILFISALACSLALSASRLAAAQAPPPGVIHLPAGALVPDVAVGGDGTLHMVYGLGDHAWYVQSRDAGLTFTPPVRVNSKGQVSLTMGERGPKLALGKHGSIHVVWADRWAPGVQVFARYTRSLDGGKTFEPARPISPMPGIDGLTLAADADGHLAAFWHVAEPPQKLIPSATWLYLTQSADNGTTFSPAQRVKIANLTDLACSMCMTRARFGPDGSLCLAFRSAENNIRDFYLLKSPKTENNFQALRVNRDNWELTKCPMCGPELTFDSKGNALCAFMSRHKVYWSRLDAGSAEFKLHVPTPANENDEIYPAAIANREGQVLMIWQVGPMSVAGKATVKWALYNADGTFANQQGALGIAFSGTKPTLFVTPDDRFHIVTTAK